MDAAEIQPDIPASIAFLSLLDISIRALQQSQLVAEKLFSSTNFLKEIRPPQSGQHAIWFFDIGSGFAETAPGYNVETKYCASEYKTLSLARFFTEMLVGKRWLVYSL